MPIVKFRLQDVKGLSKVVLDFEVSLDEQRDVIAKALGVDSLDGLDFVRGRRLDGAQTPEELDFHAGIVIAILRPKRAVVTESTMSGTYTATTYDDYSDYSGYSDSDNTGDSDYTSDSGVTSSGSVTSLGTTEDEDAAQMEDGKLFQPGILLWPGPGPYGYRKYSRGTREFFYAEDRNFYDWEYCYERVMVPSIGKGYYYNIKTRAAVWSLPKVDPPEYWVGDLDETMPPPPEYPLPVVVDFTKLATARDKKDGKRMTDEKDEEEEVFFLSNDTLSTLCADTTVEEAEAEFCFLSLTLSNKKKITLLPLEIPSPPPQELFTAPTVVTRFDETLPVQVSPDDIFDTLEFTVTAANVSTNAASRECGLKGLHIDGADLKDGKLWLASQDVIVVISAWQQLPEGELLDEMWEPEGWKESHRVCVALAVSKGIEISDIPPDQLYEADGEYE